MKKLHTLIFVCTQQVLNLKKKFQVQEDSFISHMAATSQVKHKRAVSTHTKRIVWRQDPRFHSRKSQTAENSPIPWDKKT